jgi:6-hydroxycyclohex-1-ene-1-carbonyl-CoA dehydrogenase
VIAIDVDARKLEAAAPYCARTIDARSADAKAMKKLCLETAREHGGRDSGWKIFECSGSRAGQESAFSLLVPGATLMIVGFTREKVEVRLSNLMALHAKIQGNWGCTPERYPAALEEVLAGRVEVAPFVELRPLDSIEETLAQARAHLLQRRIVFVP